jgi:hypothetical protein
MCLPRRGPSPSVAVMVGPSSWFEARASEVPAGAGEVGHWLFGRLGAGRCDSAAAIVPRSTFNAFARSPVVLCGWSCRHSMMRPSRSSVRWRAVARRALARRAVARRVERCGTTGNVPGVGVGVGAGAGASFTVRCVCIAEDLPTLMEVSRERTRERDPTREPAARPCGLDQLDHGTSRAWITDRDVRLHYGGRGVLRRWGDTCP